MPTVRAVLASTTIVALAVMAGCGSDEKGGGPAPTTVTSSAPTVAPSPTPTAHLTGIGKLAPAQIRARAKAALKSADSVRVKGREVQGGTSTNLDLALTRTGGKAVLSIGAQQITVITIGKVGYVQGNDAFWKSMATNKQQGEAYAALFRGKWLKTKSGDEQFGTLSDLAVKDSFIDSVLPGKTLSKTGARIVDGINCVGVRDKESLVWIDQVTGRPVRAQDPTGTGSVAFTDYNQVPAPQAPPQNLIVDTSALG